MASQFPPKKNTAFTLYFTLFKNDGTIIANPGTITKKVSIDGGAVADIAAAVTEEDTTYGQCSVVLSASEMNGDAIWIYIVDDTAGCIPFVATVYTAAQTLDEVKAETAAILTDTGTTLDALIKDVPTVAEFNARTLPAADYFDASADQVIVATNNDKAGYALSAAGVDAILDDAPAAELAAIPSTTGTLRQMVQFLFGYFRNKRTVTATTETLYKEDGTTPLGTATVSDDGEVFTKGEAS